MGTTRRYRPLALVAAASLAVGGVVAVVASADPPGDSVAGWPRQIGAGDEEIAYDVTVSSSGDVFIVGSADPAFVGQTPNGQDDAFLARLDKFGRLVWLRQFGTSEIDQAHGVVVSGSSIYVAGQTRGTFSGQVHAGENDGFVAKYDMNGNQKWLRQFGTSDNDFVQELAYASSDLYIVGHTAGAFPNETNVGGGGTLDFFVTRYSVSGVHELTYQDGSTKDDHAYGIAVSGSDTYVVGDTAGDFAGAMNVDGGGTITDVIFARYDKSGILKADNQFGAHGNDTAYDVTVSGTQIYVTGTTAGQLPGAPVDPAGADAFLMRFDKSAVVQWVTQLDAGSDEEGSGVAVRSGKVYVTGTTDGSIAGWTHIGGVDGFVAKFGTNGIQEWGRQFGTDEPDFPVAIAVRSNDSYGGALVVAGYTEGRLWGQFRYGDEDAFVGTFLS